MRAPSTTPGNPAPIRPRHLKCAAISATSLANSGAGCQKPASSRGLRAKRFIACTTLNSPWLSA